MGKSAQKKKSKHKIMANIQSNSNQNENKCRICLSGCSLIIPCDCVANFAFVHSNCLENWLEMTDHQFCDICRFKYIMNRKKKSWIHCIKEQTQQTEELIEMCVRTVNIVHILLLGIVVFFCLNTSSYKIRGVFCFLVALRGVNLLRTWILLIVMLYRNWSEWRKTHLKVTVFPNPKRMAQ